MTTCAMWDEGQLVVSGVEALNGLGFSAYQTWALRRADVRALKESPFVAWSGQRIAMGHIDILPEDDFGAPRFHQILTEISKQWSSWLRGRVPTGRLASALTLPERYATEMDHPRFSKERAQLAGVHQELMRGIAQGARCEVHPYGHAGAAYSIQWAGQQLSAGEADLAIVAGVDSYYDPDVIDGLLEREQLHLGGIEGLVPGEGGALLVITTRRFAQDTGLPILATLDGASVNVEPIYSAVGPNHGSGLTDAVCALTDAMAERGGRVDWWLGDVSNEAYRVREYQLAFPRFSARVSHDESRMEFLPNHFGDLGAATLPTAITIAVEAFSRAASNARNCLAWASSHGSTRGAVLIGHPNPGALHA
ncbi:MAG: hypothetical protein KC619_22740 [Myxococcales bacterium]|nr:hypothetical protein [Myxococcales bacterium]